MMSLKHAILGFLSFKPFSGYDLKKAFDRSVRHFWPANQSQIYRTLAELEKQGYVGKEVLAFQEHLDKKVYSITEPGRAELLRWLSTPLPAQDERNPFLIQVYFSGLLSDEELLHLFQEEVRRAEEELSIYTAIYQEVTSEDNRGIAPRTMFLSMLTLEYGLAGCQALLGWLNRAIGCIQSGDYSPLDLSIYQE